MRRKKIIGFSVGLAAVSVFFAFTVLFMFGNTKISATENGESDKLLEPDTYFAWKNDWQLNKEIIVSLERNESKVINPVTNYNRAIANYFKFDLAQGDTKPVLNSSAYTFALSTPAGALNWPVFNSIDSKVQYEYSNSPYWKGLPENVNGTFISENTNFPNVSHWTSWPNVRLNSTALVMYPKGSTQKDWLSYTFSSEVPNSVSIGVSTQVSIDDSYEKPESPDTAWMWGNGWNIEVPQLVKAVFKDVDNPSGDSIAVDEIEGYEGEMGDSVTLKNKEINGFEFTSSQIVLGPTINSTAFSIGTNMPKSFYYDDKTKSVKDSTVDSSWQTNIDRQQKGIVFWYKKKAPNISLNKEVDHPEARMGDKLMYTLKEKNIGNETLLKSAIVDVVPEGLSKPESILLDGEPILEGEGSSIKGEYFTWNETSNELQIFTGDLETDKTKEVTYKTTIISGIQGEQKINTASLVGDNTEQRPIDSAVVTILKDEKRIDLKIPDIFASRGDSDISFIAEVSSDTNDTDLKNATLTINYPEDNLMLGVMKITQNGKDISGNAFLDVNENNLATIKEINAENIDKYPLEIQFDEVKALNELEKTSFFGEIVSEDSEVEKGETHYFVEIGDGDLKLLWVPNIFEFQEENTQEALEEKGNVFESTTGPTYTVVSDTRSKKTTNGWRVSVSTESMEKENSDEKISDISYVLSGNELKEYTANDNSQPPNEENTRPAPESWKNLLNIETDVAIKNEFGYTSDFLSTKSEIENGKYAIKINQAFLKIDDLTKISDGDYKGLITWTLVDAI